MYPTGIATWSEFVKISRLFCAATRWTSRIGKSRLSRSFFTGRRIFRYVVSVKKIIVSSSLFLSVLRYQRQEQLQLWKAIPLVSQEAYWWPKPRVRGHASLGTTGSSDGSRIPEEVRTRNVGGPEHIAAGWRWWRPLNMFETVRTIYSSFCD